MKKKQLIFSVLLLSLIFTACTDLFKEVSPDPISGGGTEISKQPTETEAKYQFGPEEISMNLDYVYDASAALKEINVRKFDPTSEVENTLTKYEFKNNKAIKKTYFDTDSETSDSETYNFVYDEKGNRLREDITYIYHEGELISYTDENGDIVTVEYTMDANTEKYLLSGTKFNEKWWCEYTKNGNQVSITNSYELITEGSKNKDVQEVIFSESKESSQIVNSLVFIDLGVFEELDAEFIPNFLQNGSIESLKFMSIDPETDEINGTEAELNLVNQTEDKFGRLKTVVYDGFSEDVLSLSIEQLYAEK